MQRTISRPLEKSFLDAGLEQYSRRQARSTPDVGPELDAGSEYSGLFWTPGRSATDTGPEGSLDAGTAYSARQG